VTERKNYYQFGFDDDRVYYGTSEFDMAVAWNWYGYFAESENSLFIFPKTSLYEAFYFSRNELGTDLYEDLKRLASERLIDLHGTLKPAEAAAQT
jgi:hypothetical protein